MINIRTIRNLKEDDGLTLKNGKRVNYKTGWQVATSGIEAATPEAAMTAVKQYNGSCGIWYSGGIYYIDQSIRVNTKREAMEIGRKCNQISVLRWHGMKLFYC